MALDLSTHMATPLSHSRFSLSWRRLSLTTAVSFHPFPATAPASLSLKDFVPSPLINAITPCVSMGESNPTFSDFEQQISQEHSNKAQRQSYANPVPIQQQTITLAFINEMIEDFKNQKPSEKKYAYEIIKQARDLFRPLPSLVDVTVPDGKHVTVCGDLHGQLYDLLHIFELNGLPSENNPGNHESQPMNKGYGFHREVVYKLGEEFIEQFDEVFQCIPLAHVINQKIFVVHGGLSPAEGIKLSDISAIDRFHEPAKEGLMTELLWNDPAGPGSPPASINRPRGVGYIFSVYVTNWFLRDNNLDLVVRSHEVRSEGYEVEHEGKLITVFSASNY